MNCTQPNIQKNISSKLLNFVAELENNYNGPTLVFDLALLRKRLNLLLSLEKEYNCHFIMPVKSFRHPLIYQVVSEYISGFDISNFHEYEYLPDNLENKLVSLTDPGFDGYELQQFLSKKNHLTVHIETLEQYARLQRQETTVNFGVRLNSLLILDEYNSQDKTPYRSRFGAPPLDINLLQKITEPGRHKFVGFHIHNGASENSSDVFLKFAQAVMFIAEILGINLRHIDLGGGFLNVGFQSLEKLIQQLRSFVTADIKLIFEPGDLLFSGTGFACGMVKSRKLDSKGCIYTLDISKECHLRWSDPKLLYNRQTSDKKINASFYGPTCYEGDLLGSFDVYLSSDNLLPYQEGDLVLFSNISAYSVSWNTSFNGIQTAQVEFLE
ncbi:hypothetical protein H6G81_23705 [Scytonema hofmannii FACHB-248]|uniref:Orn/DAP/Arg decarboxylase 2 N-terminal domain-containing protein n=1 Tax=Scytonema hofmannii FACHB-248 TaxID=1842502 RepID=A0ABR8GWH7_9CYAN|nr:MULTISPECIES: hypothetical protein [Nostocales]MBD2607449.1 hypothetical protein [Scytonema hofmannii FACHB-248]